MVPEKTCDDILRLPRVGLSLGRTFACLGSPFLMKTQAQGLKIRTIARATVEADPAASLAAILGRPFPGIELFDRVADTVFFIKDHEARYVAVNETLAHRCRFADKSALIGRKASEVFAAPLGERFEAQDLKVIAEGLSIRGQDGASSLSGRQRRLVSDLEGAADRCRRRHSRPGRHFPRRAGFVGVGAGFGGAFSDARLYRRSSR